MKFKRDSLLHAETSALLCIVLALLLPWWGAAIAALAAGVGKELWDKRHGGVSSWNDILWDAVGVTAGVLITLI